MILPPGGETLDFVAVHHLPPYSANDCLSSDASFKPIKAEVKVYFYLFSRHLC